jgi:hypothetical protein
MTEAEAIKLGLSSYDSTNPCKQGHMDKRRVFTNECMTCRHIRDKSRKRALRENTFKQLGNMGDHPLYSVYRAMMNRCYNQSTSCWCNYGGLGITVCDRWRKGDEIKRGFWYFVDDMGVRPEGTSIDRIDSAGNYEPANCRWATVEEQTKNRRKYGTVNATVRKNNSPPANPPPANIETPPG